MLAVTAVADNLEMAADRAHQGVSSITFEGSQHRSDIGRSAYPTLDASPTSDVRLASDAPPTFSERSAYKSAGVDIDAANHAVKLISKSVISTHTPDVISKAANGFGGMYSASMLGDDAVLVASTDGVGTKVKLAARYGRWREIGMDIVNHCIGDIIVHGARPLFFLDYIAMPKLQPVEVAEIVDGMAEACRAARCALLGGETAEMPGVYVEGALDVVGTIVGVAKRSEMLPCTQNVNAGDVLIGVPSSGPHTNGYTLIRKLLDNAYACQGSMDMSKLVEAALAPHRSYLPFVNFLSEVGVQPKALAHITGGGFFDNIPRVLPGYLGAQICLGSWEVPELFRVLVSLADMDDSEAFRVWNMGIGLIAVVSETDVEAITAHDYTAHECHVIGSIVELADSVIQIQQVSLTGSWKNDR